ncbi:hypothetical protein M758_12G008800 [Ceratodon purpureus]|nr:hypothetical protein M758_12G008800 [Ceratodon purpureus]
MEAASEAMDSEAEAEAVEVALQSGLVALRGKNAAFMDPVRVLNAGYEAHHVRSDRYYARAFFTSTVEPVPGDADGEESRKRKRKRKVYTPNAKEAVAESRHQEVRSVILEAHEAFQKTVAPFLRKHIVFSDDDNCIASPSKSCTVPQKPTVEEGELNFVELAALWQAPLYEISFMESIDGQFGCEEEDPGTTALFNTVFENSSATSKAAQCGGCKYLLPKLSKFLIVGDLVSDAIPALLFVLIFYFIFFPICQTRCDSQGTNPLWLAPSRTTQYSSNSNTLLLVL